MRALLVFARTDTGIVLGDLTIDALWIDSDPTTDQRGTLDVGATLEEIGVGLYAYNAPLVTVDGGVSVHVTATATITADGIFDADPAASGGGTIVPVNVSTEQE